MLRLFEESAVVGLVRTLGERSASAARGSSLLARAREWRARAMGLDLSARIRCGGVLILTAILTHEGLLLMVPRQAAPAGLHAILALIALSAAAAAWAAPRFASAWVARAGDEQHPRAREDSHG